MSQGIVTILFVLYFIVVQGIMWFPPVFKTINKIEPLILGLPFVQFWLLVSTFLTGIGLIAWYKIEEKRGELE